ncbi:MAG: hypothetical protein K1W37_10415 [Lachnospiraceae bacterium]|jgi:predicted CoA-substrate-specific enzyme activase
MEKYYLGIDCGSVSVKVVITDEKYNVLWGVYKRTNGSPIIVLKSLLLEAFQSEKVNSVKYFDGIFTTGSGRFTIAEMVGGYPINEISTHGSAGGYFYPDANTIIEIGGQDSKLIILDNNNEKREVTDSQMNDICAAGTGSFLDQQAYRMGITVEELSERAYHSKTPAKISGRCSVFAKTDMIHLQQDGTSVEDISYGLCLAVVRTYIEDLIKGRKLKTPILFQGGVANNRGIRRAFIETLKLNEEDLLIPQNFDLMGAIGSVICGRERQEDKVFEKEDIIRKIDECTICQEKENALPILNSGVIVEMQDIYTDKAEINDSFFLGIDIGSVSVKLVAINQNDKIVFKYYDRNKANPVGALKEAFKAFVTSVGQESKIMGVGVTGSGREYIAKCICADIVKNEITAQAYGTNYIVNDAEVIIEIGGQDSKYIRLENGIIKDFVMNKTCAAGTGSFLSEQADRLGIDLNDFSDYAFEAEEPINVGSRCTVFMETDCIHHQQNGTRKEDIVAGLSYSIAKNYLEKVAAGKKFDGKVVIQGGIAYNKAVVAAFSNLLEKEIVIVPHHEVTGALGMAIIAKNEMTNKKSSFVGFDLESRIKNKEIRICQDCSNHCNLSITEFDDNTSVITGSICGKFEDSKKEITGTDYFESRRELLLSYLKNKSESKNGVIGIPRMLLFHELFPMWATFFQELGFKVILSDVMSKDIYQSAISKVLVDTCYPVRCVYGLVTNLLEKGVDKIYIPYVINMFDDTYETKYAHNCQYIQQIPDLVKASLGISVLTHTVFLKGDTKEIYAAYRELSKELDLEDVNLVDNAISKGLEAQKDFKCKCYDLGKRALSELKEQDKIVALLGHPYIIHDSYFNLNIAKRLKKLGMPVIPADILPIDTYHTNKVNSLDLKWKSNNRSLNIAEYILHYNNVSENKILPIFMTQFGCAADSMLIPYLHNVFGSNPYLEIEVDEHNSISGILTRCEAFWDSITAKSFSKESFVEEDNITVNQVSLESIKKSGKTLYVYPICEAMEVMPFVMKRHNICCKMIDKTSKETNELGKKFSNEKQCRTFQVMVGDLVNLVHKSDFDNKNAAILLFDYDEACRFSLFKPLYYKILCEQGSQNVEIVSTTVDDPVSWLEQFGLAISLEMWIALCCADYLYRYRFLIRPYEKEVGETNTVYDQAKAVLFNAIVEGNTINGFKKSLHLLSKVSIVDKSLVHIGITGDAFTRVHEYGMNPIFSAVEELGGVIVMPPSWNDFISYGSDVRSKKLVKKRKVFKAVVNEASSRFMYILRNQIQQEARKYSNMFVEPSNHDLSLYSKNYINPNVAPVIPSMFVGRTVDLVANKKVDGLINAYGFNCCLGKITTACINELRKEHENLPMLNFIDDGLEQTNIRTRLESFMEQVKVHI